MMTGFFLMLMLYRALAKRLPLWGATLASVIVGTGLTALIEATWYAIRRHYPFWDVLGANIDPDMFPRPTFWVLTAGVAALVVMAARNYRSVLRPAEQKRRDVVDAGRLDGVEGRRPAHRQG
jgi:hypothetical protein